MGGALLQFPGSTSLLEQDSCLILDRSSIPSKTPEFLLFPLKFPSQDSQLTTRWLPLFPMPDILQEETPLPPQLNQSLPSPFFKSAPRAASPSSPVWRPF